MTAAAEKRKTKVPTLPTGFQYDLPFLQAAGNHKHAESSGFDNGHDETPRGLPRSEPAALNQGRKPSDLQLLALQIEQHKLEIKKLELEAQARANNDSSLLKPESVPSLSTVCQSPNTGDKWIKLFLSSEEIASLTMDSLLSRIQERFPSLRSTVSVKYYDGNDWIELPADDIDSFIDMLESVQEERENLKRVTLRVNESAFSPPGLLKGATVQTVKTAQQKRLRSSPSTSPNAVSVPERKKHRIATSRCLEEDFCDTTAEWKYEKPTQKYFNKLEEEKKQQQDLVLKKQNELLELDMSSYGWPINYCSSSNPTPSNINHLSAVNFAETIDSFIETELSHEATAFQHDPILLTLQTSPLQSVDKDKTKRRIVLDLSFPHGRSVNDGIPKDTFLNIPFHLTLPRSADFVNLILSKGLSTSIGGFYDGRFFHATYPQFITQQSLHINALEILAVTVSIKLWALILPCQRIVEHTENKNTELAINSGKSCVPFSQACLRELWLYAAHHVIEISACHIPGSRNVIAFCLSRWHSGSFYQQQTPCFHCMALSLRMSAQKNYSPSNVHGD
ncbi:hypothetical protein ACROYT_G016069 [Oculina patagonica]